MSDEKEQEEFPVTEAMTQEETENYWKAVDALRRELNNLEADLLQQKCLYHGSMSSNEIAARPNDDTECEDCKPTGRRQVVVNWIDLKQQTEYEKWAKETEHKIPFYHPRVIEPLWEDEG